MSQLKPEPGAAPDAETLSLFATPVYRAAVEAADISALNDDIIAAALSYAEDDAAGAAWCEEHSYPGYTSYGSLNDLPSRATCFATLQRHLDRHAAAFARKAHLDLSGGKLKLDNIWVNVLEPGGFHSGHIHPHSVISGTYYVQTPDGASSIKFEDPRLPMMMAAPTRVEDAPLDAQNFVYLAPQAGMVLMWESWLRHEVLRNDADDLRISVSFNYRWG